MGGHRYAKPAIPVLRNTPAIASRLLRLRSQTHVRIIMRMDKVRLNLYVDEGVVREARDSGLNISRFLEEQLARHAQTTRAQCWLEENREAIRAYNERVERDGPVLQDLSLL